MRLLTRNGFCVGDATSNNLVAILDNFPIPMFAIGHDAEFNILHDLEGPLSPKRVSGDSGHTQDNAKSVWPALTAGSDEKPRHGALPDLGTIRGYRGLQRRSHDMGSRAA